MFKRISFLLLIILCFSCSKGSTPPELDIDPDFVRGKFINDWAYQVFPNGADGFDSALFSMWIPSNTSPRAILVISPGSGSTSLGDVNLKEWQDYAIQENLALIGLQIKPNASATVSSNMFALLYALKELTTKNNIESVNDLPFLFTGFSAGGRLSYNYALDKKDRTIAYANIKGFMTEVNSSETTVPGLIIVGEQEGLQRIESIKKAFYSQRKNENVTSFAIEPNSGHSIDNSNNLVRAFFSSVLKKRLISNELVDLTENEVILANYENLETYSFANYPYDKEKAVCLIDAEFKNFWLNFIK